MDIIKQFLDADAKRLSFLPPTMRPNMENKNWDTKEQQRRVSLFGDWLKLAQELAPAIRTMLADIEMAREALKIAYANSNSRTLHFYDEALDTLDKYKGGE